jgi:hypothetical protein
LALASLALAASLAGGCAAERQAINRVQADALDKHFFVGPNLADTSTAPQFYWRNFVVDASASQSLVGVGSWGHIDRVRWEITESLLIARKAYEIAPGADDKGAPASAGSALVATPNGTIVAAYKIASHFDIRRQYNPQTGEELNIVEENSTDHAWYDRSYMRVDWSQDLVDDPMWSDVFTGTVFGSLTFTPVAYYVNDPASDDAPHIDTTTGYFDVTNKFYVAPAQTASPFSDVAGTVPTCLLVGIYTGSSTYDCNAQEATVRASYQRIDEEHDFERLENTKATLDVVGNPGGIGNGFEIGVVGAGVQGWDPQYGYTDALYHRFASIHNLWQKSHQSAECASNDDADGDGTADQCSSDATGYFGSSGSQCDVFVGKCTIPYRDRQVKTVGYWVNKEAPDDLLDPTDATGAPTDRGALEDLVYSWNQLQSVAVAYAREVECRRTRDGARDDCHAAYFASTGDPSTKQMVSYGGWLIDVPSDTTPTLTFCHNPVRSYDLHATCGATGDRARVGDVRKNFVFYWPYDSRAPWGGIANWNADPLTGEIIGASATIMGRSATFAAAQQRDIIQLALGDVALSDVITGVTADVYVQNLRNGTASTALSQAEIARRIGAIDLDNLQATVGKGASAQGNVPHAVLETALDAKSVADPTMLSTALLELDALSSKVKGTTYEAQLVDSHWLVGALGSSPSTTLDDAVLGTASPLRGMDPGKLHAYQELMTERLRGRGVCFLDDEAPAVGSVYIPSLAGWFKNKYGGLDPVERGKAMYRDLWKEAVKGIGLHEIGHSLGMLHQFTSSWDSLNYDPQYWQLRTAEGQATAACSATRTGDVDSCMGPRYLDPATSDELGLADESRPGIDYFANTSTMEYQLERAGETVGLGTYDLHVMKTLYGRVLETFDSRVHDAASQRTFRFKMWTQLTERDLLDVGTTIDYRHYTTTARLAKIFDAQRDCRDATDDEKAHGGWRIVHGKVCATQPKDHGRWSDFKSDALLDYPGVDLNAPYWHATDADGVDHVRWPYRWGSGHNSYFHDNDSDAGADPYEVAVNTSKRFDATYPWTYFRRQNREYNYENIASRIADSYFDRMRSYHWLVATDLSRANTAAALASDDDLRPYVLAEKEMFDLLARAFLMPEPGGYVGPQADADVSARQPVDSLKAIFDTPSTAPAAPTFTIGIVDGRYIGEEFDNDNGGSWDYLHWVKHAGFTVEKALAMMALVDGRPTLFTISRDNFLDGRNVKINFRNDLPGAVDRLIGGALAEDWETIGMQVIPDATGGAAKSPELFDFATDGALRPADAAILFPNVGYKQQLATAVFASLFSRLNSDLTLVNKMRLWVDGQVGSVDVPDAQQVRFNDPESGYTYIARKYGPQSIDGKTVDAGIASRMLAHANAMVAAAYVVQTDPLGNTLLDPYGAPVLALDAQGFPTMRAGGATTAARLRQYVGLLDAVKELGYRLGYGPLGGTAGD